MQPVILDTDIFSEILAGGIGQPRVDRTGQSPTIKDRGGSGPRHGVGGSFTRFFAWLTMILTTADSFVRSNFVMIFW